MSAGREGRVGSTLQQRQNRTPILSKQEWQVVPVSQPLGFRSPHSSQALKYFFLLNVRSMACWIASGSVEGGKVAILSHVLTGVRGPFQVILRTKSSRPSEHGRVSKKSAISSSSVTQMDVKSVVQFSGARKRSEIGNAALRKYVLISRLMSSAVSGRSLHFSAHVRPG